LEKRQTKRAIGWQSLQVEGLRPDESLPDEPDPRAARRSARQRGSRKEQRYGSADGSPDVRLNYRDSEKDPGVVASFREEISKS